MDVSKWPLHKLMALPDWCYGPKWWIGQHIVTQGAVEKYFFIEEMPPDNFVLWDIFFAPAGVTTAIQAEISLVLCAEAPNGANIRLLTRLMRQYSASGQMFDIRLNPNWNGHLGPMKVFVEAVNNGIGGVICMTSEESGLSTTLALLISAMPKEVPDWVVSGLAGVR